VIKYIKVAFIFVGILVWVVVSDFMKFLLNLLNPNLDFFIVGHQFTLSNLLGLVSGFITSSILWKNEKVNTLSLETATELKRVTWPNWSETKTSTFIVIITTLLISALLGLFDYIWASLTSLMYGL
jgi:preprotein translocase SecE subunit